MSIDLTDSQLARLIYLCSKIAEVVLTVPAPPQGMGGELELAKSLRSSIEAQNGVLLELGALLR